jgi:hypothetical protein
MIDRANINVANAALDGYESLSSSNSRFFFSSWYRLLNQADPQSNQRILPQRKSSEHGQNTLESTYNADFPPPYPYEMRTVAHSGYADKVNSFRINSLITYLIFIEPSEISR